MAGVFQPVMQLHHSLSIFPKTLSITMNLRKKSSKHDHDYYVYVYIDPRNFEEFYYGKGRGTRKDFHLKDKSVNGRTSRIADIRKAGLEPLVRVIARDLTESEALLIEKTLLWKLGKNTTNKSPGHFKNKFRPHNMLHKELFGFDFDHNFFYYNVGENRARNWDDYYKYGFISAGWGPKFRNTMKAFNEGDIIAAYLKSHGFVGVGRITHTAQMIRDIRIAGKSLLDLPLVATHADHNCDDEEQCEYVCTVKWLAKVRRDEAKKSSGARLFTNPQIRASLENHRKTVAFIEREFGVDIDRALKRK
jgi:uncharacterized protein